MQNSSERLVTPTALLLGAIGAVLVGFGVVLLVGSAPYVPAAFRFNGDALILIGAGVLLIPVPLIQIVRKKREGVKTRQA